MEPFQVYLGVTLGVFVAVVFPILRAAVAPKPLSVDAVGIPPWLNGIRHDRYLHDRYRIIVFVIYLNANKDAVKTVQWLTPFLVGFA